MQGRFFRAMERFKDTQNSTPGLPFSKHLTAETIHQTLKELGIVYRNRVYTHAVTLWMFMSQVLSPDGSCCNAVAGFIAYCAAIGRTPPSSSTSSYCDARLRLPLELISGLARKTGQEMHQQAEDNWKTFGRNVKVVDGSTSSMPDGDANEAYFGKASNQYGPVGFPIARFVAVFCLATGAALEMAIGPYRGKRTGELSLFRTLLDTFEKDDILLGDELYCNYTDIAALRARGADIVTRLRNSRKTDFRKGRRLGKCDHVVVWKRPQSCPDWMTEEEFDALPATMELREMRIRITRAGFRSSSVLVLTTLLDAERYSKQEVGDLFRKRWCAELDLHSIKVSLQMDVLRCQSPDMVLKEMWVCLLTYNLVRSVMCSAALEQGLQVRSVSFKGALQTLNAFTAHLLVTPASSGVRTLCDALLFAVSRHRVGNRPDRFEPRKRRRQAKPYPRMKRTREEERNELAS